MEQQKITRFGTKMPRRERQQGIVTGVGATIIVMAIIVIGLLLLPQKNQHAVDTQAHLSEAAFQVKVNRNQLNALVEQYLNNDPTLKHKIRFEMTKSGMMLYGTYKILGQPVDYGLKMTPEVTHNGGILLHADSVAVGQLPLPVKYVMGYIGHTMMLPKWLSINAGEQTILINMGELPKVNGMRFRADKIDPIHNQFIFRGGFEQ